MKLSLIGSIKIDSRWRKKLLENNLVSLAPISPTLSWRFNIVGKYADHCNKKIKNNFPNAHLTSDDNSSYYKLVKDQIKNSETDLLLFWLEDHWFVCPNENFFYYLLQKFRDSDAQILTITHLVSSWERKNILPVVNEEYLYKEYQLNLNSHRMLLEKYPSSYLTGIPAIYKKKIAQEILEFKKQNLDNSKKPNEFELHGDSALEFLRNYDFTEMIPSFHVFREVFKKKKHERSIGLKEARQILKLRGNGDL